MSAWFLPCIQICLFSKPVSKCSCWISSLFDYAILYYATIKIGNTFGDSRYFFCSLANLAESEHEIPEKIIWNYLIDLLMVSSTNTRLVWTECLLLGNIWWWREYSASFIHWMLSPDSYHTCYVFHQYLNSSVLYIAVFECFSNQLTRVNILSSSVDINMIHL